MLAAYSAYAGQSKALVLGQCCLYIDKDTHALTYYDGSNTYNITEGTYIEGPSGGSSEVAQTFDPNNTLIQFPEVVDGVIVYSSLTLIQGLQSLATYISNIDVSNDIDGIVSSPSSITITKDLYLNDYKVNLTELEYTAETSAAAASLEVISRDAVSEESSITYPFGDPNDIYVRAMGHFKCYSHNVTDTLQNVVVTSDMIGKIFEAMIDVRLRISDTVETGIDDGVSYVRWHFDNGTSIESIVDEDNKWISSDSNDLSYTGIGGFYCAYTIQEKHVGMHLFPDSCTFAKRVDDYKYLPLPTLRYSVRKMNLLAYSSIAYITTLEGTSTESDIGKIYEATAELSLNGNNVWFPTYTHLSKITWSEGSIDNGIFYEESTFDSIRRGNDWTCNGSTIMDASINGQIPIHYEVYHINHEYMPRLKSLTPEDYRTCKPQAVEANYAAAVIDEDIVAANTKYTYNYKLVGSSKYPSKEVPCSKLKSVTWYFGHEYGYSFYVKSVKENGTWKCGSETSTNMNAILCSFTADTPMLETYSEPIYWTLEYDETLDTEVPDPSNYVISSMTKYPDGTCDIAEVSVFSDDDVGDIYAYRIKLGLIPNEDVYFPMSRIKSIHFYFKNTSGEVVLESITEKEDISSWYCNNVTESVAEGIPVVFNITEDMVGASTTPSSWTFEMEPDSTPTPPTEEEEEETTEPTPPTEEEEEETTEPTEEEDEEEEDTTPAIPVVKAKADLQTVISVLDSRINELRTNIFTIPYSIGTFSLWYVLSDLDSRLNALSSEIGGKGGVGDGDEGTVSSSSFDPHSTLFPFAVSVNDETDEVEYEDKTLVAGLGDFIYDFYQTINILVWLMGLSNFDPDESLYSFPYIIEGYQTFIPYDNQMTLIDCLNKLVTYLSNIPITPPYKTIPIDQNSEPYELSYVGALSGNAITYSDNGTFTSYGLYSHVFSLSYPTSFTYTNADGEEVTVESVATPTRTNLTSIVWTFENDVVAYTDEDGTEHYETKTVTTKCEAGYYIIEHPNMEKEYHRSVGDYVTIPIVFTATNDWIGYKMRPVSWEFKYDGKVTRLYEIKAAIVALDDRIVALENGSSGNTSTGNTTSGDITCSSITVGVNTSITSSKVETATLACSSLQYQSIELSAYLNVVIENNYYSTLYPQLQNGTKNLSLNTVTASSIECDSLTVNGTPLTDIVSSPSSSPSSFPVGMIFEWPGSEALPEGLNVECIGVRGSICSTKTYYTNDVEQYAHECTIVAIYNGTTIDISFVFADNAFTEPTTTYTSGNVGFENSDTGVYLGYELNIQCAFANTFTIEPPWFMKNVNCGLWSCGYVMFSPDTEHISFSGITSTGNGSTKVTLRVIASITPHSNTGIVKYNLLPSNLTRVLKVVAPQVTE